MLCWFKIWRTHIHTDACARDLYHIKLLPSEHFAKAVTNYLHRWWIIRIRNAYRSLKVSCFRNCQWKVWREREREDRKHTHIQYLQILIGCLIAFTNSIDTFIHKICINFDMHEQNVQFWVFVMQFSFWYYDDGRNCLCVFLCFVLVHMKHLSCISTLIHIFIWKIFAILIGYSIHNHPTTWHAQFKSWYTFIASQRKLPSPSVYNSIRENWVDFNSEMWSLSALF